MSDVEQIDVQTVATWFEDGSAVIVDVREPVEHDQLHVPGSVHIPMSSFDPALLPSIEDGKHLVFMCAVGQRSQTVANHLIEGGQVERAVNMVGGLQAWIAAGKPVSQ